MTDSEIVLNLLDRVVLKIDLPTRAMEDVKAYLGDVVSRYGAAKTEPPMDGSRRRVDVGWDVSPSLGGLRGMEPHISARDGFIYDHRRNTLISREDPYTLRLVSSTISTEWMMWLLQLLLLESGATMLHCAGVEHRGEAILFPSWGGVGKTAIAKGFVRDEGWRLLGDDFVMLSTDQTVSGFPKSMVLYPYHRRLFPEVFEGGEGPIAPTMANNVLTHLVPVVKPVLRRVPSLLAWARSHNPQSVRIPPSRVFGDDAIATHARVRAVVWLERDAAIEAPAIRKSDDTFLSRLAGSTMSEFDRHCVGLTPMMSGLGVIPFAGTYGAWIPILKQALLGSENIMLNIPASMPVSEVPTAVKSALASEGLFESHK